MRRLDWWRAKDPRESFLLLGSAEARAVRIREIFDDLRAKVTACDCLACDCDADFGTETEVYYPDCGYQSDGATWTTRVTIDGSDKKPAATPGFIIGSYAHFKGFRFVGECWNQNEDGGLIGWRDVLDKEKVRADYKIPKVGKLIIEDCIIDGRKNCDWPIYIWVPNVLRRQLVMTGGELYGSRAGVNACGSGSSAPDSPIQDLLIIGTKFFMDAGGSRSLGESSSRDRTVNGTTYHGAVLTPVLIREGRAYLDIVSQCTGLTSQYDTRNPRGFGCDRIAGLVSDTYYSDGQRPQITLAASCRTQIVPNLADEWNDVDVRRGTVHYESARGSNADGSLKVRST